MLADALANQTVQDYDLVIVDEMVERHDLIRQYLEERGVSLAQISASKEKCHDTAWNQLNAINTGILLSTGDPIILYNDYMWIPPNSIERVLECKELLDQNVCISAIGKMYDDHREKDFLNPISVWKDHWHGTPEENDCVFSYDWHPEIFELFYTAFPYKLLEAMNGFQECCDYEVGWQWKFFLDEAQHFGGKPAVDRGNICYMVNHGGWSPENVWKVEMNPSEGSRTFRRRENCFDLKNHERGTLP